MPHVIDYTSSPNPIHRSYPNPCSFLTLTLSKGILDECWTWNLKMPLSMYPHRRWPKHSQYQNGYIQTKIIDKNSYILQSNYFFDSLVINILLNIFKYFFPSKSFPLSTISVPLTVIRSFFFPQMSPATAMNKVLKSKKQIEIFYDLFEKT